MVQETADPTAYEWLRLGVRAAIDGSREDARYYFVQAVRIDPGLVRGWLYLGGVADDPALTLTCLNKVLLLDPSNADARVGIIWAREKLGLIQPVPLPENMGALENARATGVLGLNLPQQPATAAPAPDPDADQPVNIPASSDLTQEPEQAGPALQQGVETALAATLDGSGRLLRRGTKAAIGGDRARARYFFLKSIAANPDNARAWLYLGGVAEDASITLACLERVLQSEPHNPDAQTGVRWALVKLGINGPTMRWWRP